MFVAGIDIGYSNLKLVSGEHDADAPDIFCCPVGAMPVDANYLDLLMPGQEDQGIMVNVGDQNWVAGVEPVLSERKRRVLDADYVDSDQYKALFYASLLKMERPEIDLLVTGLPMHQYLDSDFRKKLSWMQGGHQITDAVSVNVKKIMTVGQPMGAYYDCAVNMAHDYPLNELRVLVLDIGFFSSDWSVITKHCMQGAWSGSSMQATSTILEKTCSLLQKDFGKKFSRNDLEHAVRNQKNIMAFQKNIDYGQYIKRAAKNVLQDLVGEVKEHIREQDASFDAIIMVGGGAQYLKEMAGQIEPSAMCIQPDRPVVANAHGFWDAGCIALARLSGD